MRFNTLGEALRATGIEDLPMILEKMQVDAKVVVWMDGSKNKYCRHFSHFENNNIYVFDGGLSSWSGIPTGSSTSTWDHWVLVE